MVKNFRDIETGAIVKSVKGKTYILLTDSEGNKGLFDKNGVWSRVNYDTMTFGKNDSGEVDTVKVFSTMPSLDRISEALKMVYTGRPACAPLTTIYTREPAEVTAARKALADAKAAADRAAAVIAAYGF